MTQPDGTTVGVRIVGDEFHHFYLSEDGYLLVNDNETFYYADVDDAGRPVRSGIEASDPQSRSAEAERYLSAVDMDRVLASMENRRRLGVTRRAARRGPGLFPGAHFPATGEQKAIVILVEYSDVDMSLDEPLDYFSRMLSQEGFSDYGGTGSARDYFIECSHGLFVPEFDVFGPVRLPNTRAYYGANDFYGDDVRPADMIIEACQALDDEVDFSEYDRDGDGFIDNVFVFYAGAGEASGGPATSVWPHSWNVMAATATPYLFDGVQLDRYACTNEWVGHRPDGVGTFIHEFSHVIGLPDLYATSYTSSFTPGSWSALDSGPYNNNGCTPPLYSAFERYSLGWLEPVEIDGPVSATLLPISENVAGIIRTGDDNEYFLLENRQQAGWDAYIPGHGMLVWHIDYDADVWEQNIVNNKSTHQYVDIEEADDSRTDKSRAGDAFPGTANVTSLTDDTRPSTLTWDGQRLDRPITGIAESEAGIITFDVLGGSALPASTAADEADEVGVDGFTARWQAADPDSEYVLSVYTKGQNSDLSRTATADNIAYLPGFNHRRVGRVNSYAVTGGRIRGRILLFGMCR